MKFIIRIVTLSGLLCSAVMAADKPNFVIIFTDDQGYGDISAYGKTDIVTPNMDRIGKEGVLFTQMRANCTVCTPSRAALLTGKHADRVGAPGVIRTTADNSWGYLDPSASTLADELKKVGYHTALVGKWHLGLESPNIPNERGFDFFHGFLGDMMNDYYQGLGFDVFPTFLEIAGAKIDEELDAVSLMPIVKGGKIEAPRELYFVRREGGEKAGKAYQAIIVDGWKLMQNNPFSPLALYNLNEDPQETKDLAATEGEKFKQLTDRLRYHIQRGESTPRQKPAP